MGCHPWKGNDPRPTAKALGITEIILSVSGLLGMISLSFVCMDVADEVKYINSVHNGSSEVFLENNDASKRVCIEEYLIGLDAEEVKYEYDLFFNLTIWSEILSLFAGLLIFWVGLYVIRSLLLAIFAIQWICIGMLISSLVTLNSPTLCLLEYGGISGNTAAIYLQTILSCVYSLYLIIIKGFSVWFITAYTERAAVLIQRSELEDNDFKFEKTAVAELAESITAIQNEMRRSSVTKKKERRESSDKSNNKLSHHQIKIPQERSFLTETEVANINDFTKSFDMYLEDEEGQ